MGWLQPSIYEKELLANLRGNLAQDIIDLAKYTVLTPRIEPLLLRNIRLEMMPGSETELEHRLWFSALVNARSTRTIVLHQGIARLLADELLEDEEEFANVWENTQNLTRHWPPLDRLEQQLRYDALLNDQSAINLGLQDVLRLIHKAKDQESRLNLSRWAKKTLPAIAEENSASDEIAWLAQYAAATLGATANWTKLSARGAVPDWLGTVANLSQSKIGLSLRYDDNHGQVIECLSPEDAVHTLSLPSPLPANIYIKSDNEVEGFWATVNPGVRIKISSASKRIELTTIDGKRYELLAEFDTHDTPSKSLDGKFYLSYIPEDQELAHKVAQELESHHINVTLIPESTNNQAFPTSDKGNKLLRLWTPAAQRQWQQLDIATQQQVSDSLLLQWQRTELPIGEMSAQVIKVDELTSHIDEIKKWLAQTPGAVNINQELPTFGISQQVTIKSVEKSESVISYEIEQLLKELEKPETRPRRRLEIGDRLAELGDPRKGVGVKAYEIIEYSLEIQHLLDELNDIRTEPPRRLEIGNQLAELGDPRPGVGLNENDLPDIDWVEIPAGSFIYGEHENQQTISLDHFNISNYPITNSQYQAFIDDGGYQDDRWWQDLIKPELAGPKWKQINRPRESTDWYEALAFTRWLSNRLGFAIMLPTEQQWEKSARGTDGRKYPWGNEYQSGYANVDEIDKKIGTFNLLETSAVGLYFHSKSIFNVSDMAGNVWEWCLNKYNQPTQTVADISGDDRVIRGGSWYYRHSGARSDYRLGGSPDYRDGGIGFRVVCSSPYNGT